MCNWKPGQKVVCIDANWQPPYTRMFHSLMPVQGQVYTIRGVYWDGYYDLPGVWLEESTGVIIYHDTGPHERGFLAHYFEPVVDDKGMETLRAILKLPLYEGKHWYRRQKEDKRKRQKEKT